MRDLILPLAGVDLDALVAGEQVLITGRIVSARDEAHRRMMQTGTVPFDPALIPVYYCGSSPAPEGMACGSCGPTTSARMEPYIPFMLARGMKMAIGKGDMSDTVRKEFLKSGAVYLAAVGGAGALAASRVTGISTAAWPELGPEAVRFLTVRRFPAFVAWDRHGGSIYPGEERIR